MIVNQPLKQDVVAARESAAREDVTHQHAPCDVKQIQARRASECISSGGNDALACASSLSKERSTIVKHATRILCVWLPNWPIQRLVVQRPELRRQQVLLFRRDSRRGNLVNAASPLARQAGCRVGMPLSEAKSLLRRSQAEQTFFFEHDLKQDVQAIEQLCQSLDGFSPTVGLELIDDRDFKQGKRPAAILLDVTGLDHLFGDENHLACRLMKHLEADGYLGRIAIANTVGRLGRRLIFWPVVISANINSRWSSTPMTRGLCTTCPLKRYAWTKRSSIRCISWGFAG